MLLHHLPTELLLDIARSLRHHDLAQLARVSHRFHEIVEPLIWESIELHPCYFHKTRRPRLPRAPEDYKFLLPAKSTQYNGYQRHLMDESTTYFFRICGIMRRRDPKRWRQLASRVRSLCLTIDEANGIRPGDVIEGKTRELDCWNTLLAFENLQVLDVIARKDAEHNRLPLDYSTPSFKKLRCLRMRGYFPRSFVRQIYYGASNLQSLDLGVLHFPPDLPSRDSGTFESDSLDADGGTFPRFVTGLFKPPTCHSPFLTRVHLCKPTEPADRARTDWDKDPEVPRDVRVLDTAVPQPLPGLLSTMLEYTKGREY